jgi:hypothetical protein
MTKDYHFHRKMHNSLPVHCHPYPIWPPALPVNLTCTLLILLLLFHTSLLYKIKAVCWNCGSSPLHFHKLSILLRGISKERDEEWRNESTQMREQDSNTEPYCSLSQDSDHRCHDWSVCGLLSRVISASVHSIGLLKLQHCKGATRTAMQ